MKRVYLIPFLLILFISCNRNAQLTGKYICVNSTSGSYFEFLPDNKVKYRDTRTLHTLYLFRYKVEKNRLNLSNEYGDFSLRLVDENTIEVEKSEIFSRYKLVYRKINH